MILDDLLVIPADAITADAQSIAVPLTQDINSDEIAARVRAGRYFYVADGSSFVAQEHANVNKQPAVLISHCKTLYLQLSPSEMHIATDSKS